MKNTSKRIILSIVTLVLVVVALGTTTFAWFTLSGTTTVSDITGQVQAGEGLEIALSVNGTTPLTPYRTNLDSTNWDTIMTAINTANGSNPDFDFGAVSTENGYDFFTLKSNTTTPSQLDKAASNGKNTKASYLEFVIHFRSDTGGTVDWTDYNFNDITGNTTLFEPTSLYHQTSISGAIDTPLQVASSNAARIGIDKDGTNIVIVEKGEDTTFVNNYGQTTGLAHGQFSYIQSKGNTIFWENGTSLGTPTQIIDATNVDVYPATTDLSTAGKTIATLDQTGGTGPYLAEVTVRVWLEGWDADAYDSIFQLGLNFNLEFKKA